MAFQIRCAIFDFDGTLFDSMEIWETAGLDYIRMMGREPDPELREVLRPLSMWQCAVYMKETYDLPLPEEEIIDGINLLAEDFYLNKTQPREGVIPFIRELRATGASVCIATANDRFLIDGALKRCGMRELFDDVITCDDVGSGKDSPEIYRRAMERFGADRGNTIVFEDACHAVRTAAEDGFLTVGVRDRFEKRQDEVRAASSCYLEDYEHAEAFREFLESLS